MQIWSLKVASQKDAVVGVPSRPWGSVLTMQPLPLSDDAMQDSACPAHQSLQLDPFVRAWKAQPPSGAHSRPSHCCSNPLKKVPALIRTNGTNVIESQVILSYLEDRYKDAGPSLEPATADGRAEMELDRAPSRFPRFG